jgi:lysophospholipase L1-like esterase
MLEDGMRRLFAAYLVLLHVALVVALVPGKQPPTVYERLTLAYRRVDPQIPQGATVFVGDSHVQGLCVAAVVPLAVNYGISGDTAEGVLRRLSPSLSRSRVVLCVGQNDLRVFGKTPTQVLTTYREILSRVPHAYVCGLLPTREPLPEIAEVNAGLRELTPRYIEPPVLSPDCYEADGVHLSPEGYARWVRVLNESTLSESPSPAPPPPARRWRS